MFYKKTKRLIHAVIICFIFLSTTAYGDTAIKDSDITLPQVYSSIEQGIVSPVKQQSPYGTCWAFATMACAETNCIKNGIISLEDADLSEFHLAYYTYHNAFDPLRLNTSDSITLKSDDYMNLSGSIEKATHTLSNWIGPVLERDMPYPYDLKTDIEPDIHLSKEKDIAHLEQARYIPLNDITNVKHCIMKYGSVAADYYDIYSMGEYTSDGEYCYNESGHEFQADHSIAIVGWNDSFSREAFKIKPKRDGAWLVKNSWGNRWAKNGYFWISYECSSLVSGRAVAYEFAPAAKYQYNYSLDIHSAADAASSYGSATGWMANLFTAKDEHTIEAAGFFLKTNNEKYEVSVYTDLEDPSIPSSGILRTTCKGIGDYSGFYTVKLPEKVHVKKGELFSVVIKITSPSGKAMFSSETSSDSEKVTFSCVGLLGQSFTSPDGNTWSDIGEYGNLRIKAFCNDYQDIKNKKLIILTLNTSKIKKQLSASEHIKLNEIYAIAHFSDGTNSNVTKNCTISIPSTRKAGKCKVKVSYKNITKTFTITINPAAVKDIKVKKINNSGSIQLTWKKSSAAKRYLISMSNLKTSGYKKLKSTGNCKMTISNLKKSRTYYFRIQAYGVQNGKNYYSNPVTIKYRYK